VCGQRSAQAGDIVALQGTAHVVRSVSSLHTLNTVKIKDNKIKIYFYLRYFAMSSACNTRLYVYIYVFCFYLFIYLYISIKAQVLYRILVQKNAGI